VGEAIDAAAIGLSGILAQPADLAPATFVARLRSVPREEDLAVRRQELRWDGKRFEVTMSDAKLAAGELKAAL
jgi:hypothetical protein